MEAWQTTGQRRAVDGEKASELELNDPSRYLVRCFSALDSVRVSSRYAYACRHVTVAARRNISPVKGDLDLRRDLLNLAKQFVRLVLPGRASQTIQTTIRDSVIDRAGPAMDTTHLLDYLSRRNDNPRVLARSWRLGTLSFIFGLLRPRHCFMTDHREVQEHMTNSDRSDPKSSSSEGESRSFIPEGRRWQSKRKDEVYRTGGARRAIVERRVKPTLPPRTARIGGVRSRLRATAQHHARANVMAATSNTYETLPLFAVAVVAGAVARLPLEAQHRFAFTYVGIRALYSCFISGISHRGSHEKV